MSNNAEEFVIKNGTLKEYTGTDAVIIIPEGVSKIEKSAFSYHRNITEITIPKSVCKIGKYAFSGCNNIKKITILGKITDWDKSVFPDCMAGIVAPDMWLYLFPSPESKAMAVKGFLSETERFKNPDIVRDYHQYMTSQRKKLLPFFFAEDNVTAITFYAQNKKITAKNIEEDYLTPAQENKATECLAFLLDWKNTNISREAVENHKDNELKKDPFNVADMKKLWIFKEQSDGTLMLTTYKGEQTDIILPDHIGKKTVTRLDHYLFSVVKYEEERIPSDRQKVMESITSVSIPDSITSVGRWAFRGCKGLQDKNGFVIVRGVLYDYFGYDLNLIIPEGVKETDDDIFKADYNLKSVTVPASTEIINLGSFYGCSSLERLILNDGIKIIGPSAFSFCGSLVSVTLPGSLKTIENDAFSFCEKLEEVSISNGLVEIGNRAFSCCKNLRHINIPESVAVIGERAFSDCEKLEDVSISHGLVEIGKYAFSNCKNLRRINIPASVTVIQQCPYAGKTPLEDCINVTVYCPKGSYAEAFCKEHGIPFVAE